MIKLQDFVSETIKQIIDGVISAQEYAATKNSKVNQKELNFRTDQGEDKLWDPNTRSLIQQIYFDVAITTTEGTQTKGGIGIFVGPVGVGSQGQSDAQNQSSSRIKFKIPVTLPQQ